MEQHKTTADRMRAAIESDDYPSNYLACCVAVAEEMVLEERAAQIVGGQLAGVLIDITKERHRQDAKWGWIGTDSTMSGDDDWKKNAVLGEEVGEVARALLERSLGNDTSEHLHEELIQVAAVATAWVQADREKQA